LLPEEEVLNSRQSASWKWATAPKFSSSKLRYQYWVTLSVSTQRAWRQYSTSYKNYRSLCTPFDRLWAVRPCDCKSRKIPFFKDLDRLPAYGEVVPSGQVQYADLEAHREKTRSVDPAPKAGNDYVSVWGLRDPDFVLT
jgi:hypothetical protein